MRTVIRGSPSMFVLALAWATDNAEVVDVVAVCAAIQRQVNLQDAYPGNHPHLCVPRHQCSCCTPPVLHHCTSATAHGRGGSSTCRGDGSP